MPIDASPSGTLDIENATLRSREIVALTSMVTGNDVIRSSNPPALEVYGDPSHGGNEARLELVSNTATVSSSAFTRLTSNAGVLSIKSGTDASDNGTITFGGFANERMRIGSDGNVGIGTNAPTGQLEIHGIGQTSETTFDQTGSMGGVLALRSDDGSAGSGGAVMFGSHAGFHAAIKASLEDGSTNTRGRLAFFTRSNTADATMSHAMTIADGGNVGIGVTSPDARLHLEEPSDISATTRLFHTENGFTGGSVGHFEIVEKKIGAGTGWSDFTLRLQRRVDTTEQGYIEFNPTGSTGDYSIAFGNSGGGGPGEIMRIVGQQGGKVGIGTMDPDVKLQIEGTSSSHQKLTKLATWNIFHHRDDGSFEHLITYSGSDGQAYYDNRDNFMYVQIPAFSGETLYTSTVSSYNGSYFNAKFRDLNGNKPNLSENTTYKVHAYSSRIDAYGNITTRGNVGIGVTNPVSTIDVVSTGGNTSTGGIGHRAGPAVWDHIYITCDGSNGYLLTGGSAALYLGVANENTETDYYGQQGYNGVLINDGATSVSAWSDIRIKTKIEALSDVIDSIAKLDTIKYNLKRDYAYNKKLIGLVSQNVRKYFPDLVTESKDGDLSVDYGELPVILLRAIQELQSDINRSKRVILEGIEEDPVGLLVSKNGDKCINTYNKVVSIPKVSLSNVYQDKRCVGVISSMETVEDKDIHYEEFDIISEKDTNDNFTFVKSIGKGKIWVTDMNGHFEIGDYITTSNISGYGTLQSDDILHSYTVAKITVDCDFLESYNTIEQPIKVTREVDHWVKENWVESTENEHCRLDECDCRVIGSIYYTDGTSNIFVDEYSNLESNVQSTYTEQVKPLYQRKRFKESTVEPGKSGYVKTKITRTFNAIDENGKLLWETSDQKKAMYPIRYLDLEGNVTDEANVVYKAALVDCNFVST